ncbi:MAG: hypothetical protein Q3983_01230 [Capnocytophaga sp.]|nr:hypothetical protein [Capnocytophaga sp.]
MKKLIFAFFLGIGISFAQSGNILVPQASSSSSLDNWTFGGNIGATIGSYGLGVFVTPRIGYKLTQDLTLSANVNYTLQNTEYYRNNLIGFGPELHYYLNRAFYTTTSFHHYIVSQKSKSIRQTSNFQEDALYIGAGYMQHLGGNTYMQIGASYNVLYKENKSIFSSGFVPNVGIIIGL